MAHRFLTYLVGAAVFLACLSLVSAQTTVVSSPQQARLMAKQAAIKDAQRNLAETIYGVRIDSRTTVRNFVTENDEIRSNVDAVLRGARIVDTRWEPDGTCTVRMEIPVVLLQRVLRRQFAYFSDVVSAEGHGVPNPIAESVPVSDVPPPEESWYHLTIKASGSGVAPDDLKDTPQGKLMAERAAHHDALRNLGENIKGVHITANTTVRNFITENDEIRSRFDSFLRGARRVETRHLEDGTCEVVVEISLDGMRGFIKPGAPFHPSGRPQEGVLMPKTPRSPAPEINSKPDMGKKINIDDFPNTESRKSAPPVETPPERE
jgi:hypothetical protein